MMKRYGFLAACIALSLSTFGQTNVKAGRWHARLQRKDGNTIPFELDMQYQQGKLACFIVNGQERIRTEDVVLSRDSAVIRMPLFESYFKAKVVDAGTLRGVWIQDGPDGHVAMPFTATTGAGRFKATSAGAGKSVQGKWKMDITRANQTKRHALAEFTQNGTALSGSILTPSADYRYLEGVVAGDSLFLSTFDGSHAFLIKAKVNSDHLSGSFFSSDRPSENWIAVKDAKAALTPNVASVKAGGNGKLDFTFKDLDGNPVSLQSDRYKGKVVIVQIMGSWCSNCMDETAFLSDYYTRNRNRGVEVIALAYEAGTDLERSKRTIRKFQEKFNVQYAMLITGIAAGDPQRTEKTLPQLTPITSFPTTILLDKHGVVSDIHTSFYGPASGEHYTKFKTDFEKSVNALLAQK